jgi:hypothetical protein
MLDSRLMSVLYKSVDPNELVTEIDRGTLTVADSEARILYVTTIDAGSSTLILKSVKVLSRVSGQEFLRGTIIILIRTF